MEKNADILFSYLRDILYEPSKANLDISALDEEYIKLGQGLMFLDKCLKELNGFVDSISHGNLAEDPTYSKQNPLLCSHKNLHATLRHLAWQSKQVADGDYSQRVDYLGEFGETFNEMTRQLALRQKRLEEQAYNDGLTGLYNRFYGMNVLNEWLAEKRSFAIAFLDLDYLKYINDTFGHNEGDKYILAAAQSFCIMPKDSVACRLGGDEFMLLVPDIDKVDATDLLDKYQQTLQSKDCLFAKDFVYGASFGVMVVDENNSLTSSQILHAVDEKMYINKRARKAQRQQNL